MKRTPQFLLIFLTIFLVGQLLTPAARPGAAATGGTHYAYLPVIRRRPPVWGSGLPIMLGNYVDG